QVFEYLGVRAVKNKSVWTTELELVPLGELGHPRINVLVTICGIFRDTFPYIVDLINKAVHLVIEADEPAGENYVRKNTLRMEASNITHARARVFGPAPGRYNTNITEIISAGKWSNENELAEDYISTMGHVYIENQQIVKDANAFSDLISMTEVMSQVRDSTEYHVSDLDHYYEFTGGLVKTKEFLTGKVVPVLIADTTRRTVTIDTLSRSMKEGTITRTLNPRWIGAMLKHKHHGGQKVAERVENILGMSATAHAVDNSTWDHVHAQYIQNEDIKNMLIENNRFAMMDVVKTLLQADKRGYWQASDEALDQLKKLYLELENWVEVHYP
nr:cobaltochelatase subunit CobN [Candidatus Sigynarchaeota archaeon]